jgi:hypothetical protein
VAYAKANHVPEIVGDSWSGQLLSELFERRALPYRLSPMTKADLYLRLLPLINAQQVQLLDHPQLLRELRGLERRRGWGGKDRVDHRRGQHDDLANAAAGAIVLAAEGAMRPTVRLWCSGDERSPEAEDALRADLAARVLAGGGAMFPTDP